MKHGFEVMYKDLKNGKGSLLGQISQLMVALKDEDLSTFDSDPRKVSESIEAFGIEINEKLSVVNGSNVRKSDVAGLQNALILCQEKYTTTIAPQSEDIISAMGFHSALIKTQKRNSNMKDRYQKTKFKDAFMAGGYLQKMAQRLGNYVIDVGDALPVTEPSPFSSNVVGVWRVAERDIDETGAAILTMVQDIQDASVMKVDVKVASMDLTMNKVENQAWPGCVAPIDAQLATEFCKWIGGVKPMYFDEQGGNAWLNCAKANYWRHSPNAFGLTGFAHFVQAVTVKMHMTVLNISDLSTHGIALADLQNFLETPTGIKYLDLNSTLVTLDKGDVAFVPYGHLVIPLHAALGEQKATWGYLWGFPIFNKEWANKLSDSTKRTLAAYHRSHFTLNSGRRMWSQRSETFEKFMGELGVPL